MKHFLLTRFNIRITNWELSKNKPVIIDESWLSERFELFDKYCLPSVQNQSTKEFEWLVFFDSETPDIYKEKISELKQKLDYFQPLFIPHADELRETMRAHIQSRVEGFDIIITSRLDNDDMLHQDFMQTIQGYAESGKQILVDPQNGFRLTLDHKAYKLKKKFGPFVSLIEPAENFETIYSRPHGQWRTLGKASIHKVKEPLWVQLIHGKNVINSKPLFSPRVKNFKFNDFGIMA